jgi:hypothetical protein
MNEPKVKVELTFCEAKEVWYTIAGEGLPLLDSAAKKLSEALKKVYGISDEGVLVKDDDDSEENETTTHS